MLVTNWMGQEEVVQLVTQLQVVPWCQPLVFASSTVVKQLFLLLSFYEVVGFPECI